MCWPLWRPRSDEHASRLEDPANVEKTSEPRSVLVVVLVEVVVAGVEVVLGRRGGLDQGQTPAPWRGRRPPIDPVHHHLLIRRRQDAESVQNAGLLRVHPRDPVTETPALTSAIGSWIGEVLWTVVPQDGATPARLIGEVARDRRHMFQSAGLFEALPWKVEW